LRTAETFTNGLAGGGIAGRLDCQTNLVSQARLSSEWWQSAPRVTPAATISSAESAAWPRFDVSCSEGSALCGPANRALRQSLVDQNTDGRTLFVLGEPRVNVLKLNMALDGLSPR
jgi:K+-transporting ATPase, c chain